MIRVLAVAAGLSGAAGLSQFPEFSQQYTQRLSGAVEELDRVVAGFDADARRLGLTRQAALADLSQGGRMGAARATSMQEVLARHARLSAELASAKASGVMDKVMMLNTYLGSDVARGTLRDFQPAVPVTAGGLGFGAVGFTLGYGLVLALWGGAAWLLRGRRRPAPGT